MKPPLTVDRLLPFVEEAMTRLSVKCDISALTASFVANHQNPAHFRQDPRIEAVFNRARSNEHNDYERRDLESYMTSGTYSVWAGVRIWTAESCRAAQDNFCGRVWKAGEPLPILPLEECPSIFCRCSYRPLSRRDLEKAGF